MIMEIIERVRMERQEEVSKEGKEEVDSHCTDVATGLNALPCNTVS